MRGDYSGAFTSAMRALTGQLGTPGEQNMIGKGAPGPLTQATAGAFMNPAAATPLGGTEIRAGDLLPGVPPMTATTAGMYMHENAPGATPKAGFPGAATPAGPQATPALPSGTTQAAPQTIQERAQWRAGYENWRSQNRLPDTEQNRERFNTERGYPKGSSSAAPARPAPGQAGAAPGPVERGPDPAGGGGTGMLNAIRARQGLPPLPPNSRIGAPQFSQTPPAGAASNVGENFPRGDWRQFTSNARPSTNVEDVRSRSAANAINPRLGPQGPDATWAPSSEELRQQVGARFNRNDPMTRTLMGSDRAQMRDDILKSLTPDEFMQWLGQMREQGGQLLRERWQSR
jgi:hypothetical protein